MLQHSLNHHGYEFFSQLHNIRQFGKSYFRLHHPKLHQMTARFGFLGTEGWAKAIDFPEGGCSGFTVQLPALSQIGHLVKIICLK